MAHGHGLFNTPDDIRAQEVAARAQSIQPHNAGPLGGSLFNLGFDLSGALQNKAGGGTFTRPQSTQEKTAGNIQDLIKGLDITNRKSIGTVANRLQQGGHMAEAQQLLSLMPEAVDKFGDVTSASTTVTNPDGTVKEIRQNFQRNEKDGSVKAVGSGVTTDRLDPNSGGGKPPKLNTGLWTGFGLNENMGAYWDQNLFNQVNPDWYDGALNEEQVAASKGKLEVFASRLKGDMWRDTVRTGYQQFPDDAAMANRWINAQRPPDDQVVAQKAINLIKQSGGMEDFVQFNDYMDNQVKISTETDTTPAEARERKARIDSDRGFSEANDDLVERIVHGNVDKGELNLSNVELPDGLKAFQNFDIKTAEEITRDFRDQGIEVGNSSAYQSHVQNWAWMKQQPEFTKAWMAADDDLGRRNLFSTMTAKLIDDNRMQDFWTVTRINSYLGQMKDRGVRATGQGAASVRQSNVRAIPLQN